MENPDKWKNFVRSISTYPILNILNRNTIQSLEFNKRQCVQAKDLHHAATKDALAKYGAGIPQLLAFIQQQKHLFTHIPIGPIG